MSQKTLGRGTADDTLPSLASEMAAIHFEQIIELTRQIDRLTEKIKTYSTSSATMRCIQITEIYGAFLDQFTETSTHLHVVRVQVK